MIYLYEKQFKNCHAGIVKFLVNDSKKNTPTPNTIRIFYSYTTPIIVSYNNNQRLKFTYENSRKAGSKTSSQTTSKQTNQYLKSENNIITDLHKLEKINLKDFEEAYGSTDLDNYNR